MHVESPKLAAVASSEDGIFYWLDHRQILISKENVDKKS